MSYLFSLIMLLAAQVPAGPSDSKAAPADAKAPVAAEQPPAAVPAQSTETTDAATAETSAAETAAAPPAEAAESGDGFWGTLDRIFSSGAIGLIRRGGFFMWPILFLGVIAAGVMIERYRSLKMLRTDTAALREEVQRLLQEDRVEEALALCDREQGPVPAILSSGLRKFLVLRRLNYDPGRIEPQVVKAMDDYGVHVVAALERHLPILATVSSVAPMLGFLGTVAGMIVSFDEIVATMGEKNIVEAAAGGISIALLTTCFGLIIGIPSFMAFNYFSGIINRFVLEVEESATELIEAVTLQMALDRQGTSRGTNGEIGEEADEDEIRERVAVVGEE